MRRAGCRRPRLRGRVPGIADAFAPGTETTDATGGGRRTPQRGREVRGTPGRSGVAADGSRAPVLVISQPAAPADASKGRERAREGTAMERALRISIASLAAGAALLPGVATAEDA